MPAASRRSLGIALAPAMTLNNMYHWVPRIISGDSQISGLRSQRTIRITANGNSTLAGKAARNCATGWSRCDQTGLSPIHTPAGTQTRLASAISTITRIRVSAASMNTSPISPRPRVVKMKRADHHRVAPTASASTTYHRRSSHGLGARSRPARGARTPGSSASSSRPIAPIGANSTGSSRVRRSRS